MVPIRSASAQAPLMSTYGICFRGENYNYIMVDKCALSVKTDLKAQAC